MSEVNPFISWSGHRSKALATRLRDWLPLVMQELKPWMSDVDIDAGTQALSSIGQQLNDRSVGIVCLTSENLNSRWILFECGALAKHIDTSRVIPVLLDLDHTDVAPPLSIFQSVRADEEGIRRLMSSLNSLRSIPFEKATLETVFSKWWPDLRDEISTIKSTAEPNRPREVSEKIDEALMLLRSLQFAERTKRYSLPTLDAFEYPVASYNDEILCRTLEYSKFFRDDVFTNATESHKLVSEFCTRLEDEIASRRVTK